MIRRTLGLAVALSAATAITPLMSSTALAEPTPGGSHTTTFQAPATMASLKAAAQASAADLARAVGLSADDTLTVRSVLKDADGSTHVRVDRAFKGVPVIGGDMVIDRDASGKVVRHWGFDGPITVALSPKVSKSTGTTRGLAAAKELKTRHQHGLNGAAVAGNNLVVSVDGDGNQALAYRVTVTGVQNDRTPSRVATLIDARTGATLRASDQIHQGSGQGVYDGKVDLKTTRSGNQYLLQNPGTGNYSTDAGNRQANGTVFTDSDDTWGNGSNSNRQSAGVDAQFGADKTFEYYKNVMGRNGIWDTGEGARSRVHYDNNYSNAFWDGTQMTYGDGARNAHPFTELDVASHEMSHGVTENTAGLDYSGDAGGLNEASSDIFGAGVEWYANLAADTPDYLMGEKLDLNGDGSPLRYMDKPSNDGASYDCWSSAVGKADPHFSSGPLNHWYYLASEGSGAKTINGVSYNSPTCNRSTVTGAGHADIEKVWYRALSTKLTSTSNYKAAREAAITSAVELFGASSKTCTSVQSAFDAISVPAGNAKCSGTTPTPDPKPEPTPGDDAVKNGGFESGTAGWTGTEGPINDDSRRKAHTGSWKMWLGGNGFSSTEYQQQSITVPAKGKLSFWVAIDTAETSGRTAYDTSTVSVDGTTVATFSNLSKTTGYVNKTVDLSKYAGKTVTLKFSATEDSGDQSSFVYDDVSVK